MARGHNQIAMRHVVVNATLFEQNWEGALIVFFRNAIFEEGTIAEPFDFCDAARCGQYSVPSF